jgi:hypothetical protein
MSRRFTIVTLTLAAVVAFLVGVIVAGGWHQSSVAAGPVKRIEPVASPRPTITPSAGLVNFADVVEKSIPPSSTSTRPPRHQRELAGAGPVFPPDGFDRPDGSRGDGTRRAPAADSSSIQTAAS